MSLRIVSPPLPLVSLADAKLHLRIDHEDNDAQITSLVAAATLVVEAATQRRFMTQTLEWVIDGWAPTLRLPVAPVASDGVVVAYVGDDGEVRSLDVDTFRVVPSGATMMLRPGAGLTWPALDRDADVRVRITFEAGETSPPADAVEACKLMLEYLFEGPDWVLAPSGLPLPVEALVSSLRWD